MEPTNELQKEVALFEAHREEWSRSHPGDFVAIQGDVVANGFFRTYAEALKAGLEKFGVQKSFLVKQVWITEPVYFVS